jgi:hypothetical protein
MKLKSKPLVTISVSGITMLSLLAGCGKSTPQLDPNDPGGVAPPPPKPAANNTASNDKIQQDLSQRSDISAGEKAANFRTGTSTDQAPPAKP